MNRSVERILTTHVGSLVRTPAIIEGMKARVLNRAYDEDQFAADLRAGVMQVIRKQSEIGIDIPSDGEYGRRGFEAYISERLGGLEIREPHPGEDPWDALITPERAQFADFYKRIYGVYRYLWMYPEVDISEVPNRPGNYQRCRVVGPISYTGQATIQREIDTLKEALRGLHFVDAFMPADLPGTRVGDENILDFYPSMQAYLYAVAEALRDEYRAIVNAGLIVQLDLAALAPGRRWALAERSDISDEGAEKAADQGVEIINHALQGIPEEQVRYHHCWGSGNQPHTHDPPLRTFVHRMLRIKAQAYSVEAGNPRHEHEWMVWQDVKLPDGKILIPGLISHQTNVVEHPELIAWRIKLFADCVGKENVIAGTDCGFSQFWDSIRVHPEVQWAKLKALVGGAALASAELWSS